MNPCTVKTFVRKRARERRCPGGNYLWHTHPAVLDLVDKLQQTIIAGMRRGGPFGLIQPAIMAVIIVQTTELQPCVSNRTRKPNNFGSVALLRLLCDSYRDLCRERRRQGFLAIAAPVPRSRRGRKCGCPGTDLLFRARGVRLRPPPGRREARPLHRCCTLPAVRAWLHT